MQRRIRLGALRSGRMPMTPARIATLIAQFEQPVTLQRLTGTTTQVRHEVLCQAVARGYEPHELISGSGIVQGDRSVVIANSEIADAQWPGPPRVNDKCVIDGRQTNIQACDTRRLRNETVLHFIQVRG
jgi:hypothetical protein